LIRYGVAGGGKRRGELPVEDDLAVVARGHEAGGDEAVDLLAEARASEMVIGGACGSRAVSR